MLKFTRVSEIEMSGEDDPFRCSVEGCYERSCRRLDAMSTECPEHRQ